MFTWKNYMTVKNWPINAELPLKRRLTGSHPMFFKVSTMVKTKIPSRLSWIHVVCKHKTCLPETKAGNLSVFVGDVIEETQYYWLEVLAITVNVLLDFVNSPYWCWSKALLGCYRIYPHPSCNITKNTHQLLDVKYLC